MQSPMALRALKGDTAEISVLMACVRYWVCLHVSFSTIFCTVLQKSLTVWVFFWGGRGMKVDCSVLSHFNDCGNKFVETASPS